jgi:1,2-diacylglycerol 3-alpha-glucosyltransferase
MKLLVCVCEYPPYYSSGVGNVAYEVIERLKKMGVNCTVCSPNADIKLGNSQMIQKYGRLGVYYYWHKVKKYFKRNGYNYDAVWLHQPLFIEKIPFSSALITAHTAIWEFNKMLKRSHSGYSWNLRLYYKITSRIEKYCLRKVDMEGVRFTGISSEVCKNLVEIGINKQRITYVLNGVDTEQFKPSENKKILRKKFGIPEEDLIFLSLGRLTGAKQPQKLIDVFSVIEKEKKDVSLVIAGKGELLEKTKELAKRKNLKNVTFLGYVDHEKEAPDLYACADYYIITSKYEGLPLTLLEAMASGLPCIVSDIPNLRIVEDAECGIIVDFSNSGKAAARIIEYLGRDKLEHSRNAREYAVENLDWEIIARRYLEEFKEVLSKWRKDNQR